ncbi:MAG: hypothetical protein H6718_11000 [Polyangiaceae bacterium]|nr:hypothetical protein [Polyangiaceae bacterium]MCB9607154.1 hypothetical protein [Polyangiaceae bacterium]
MRRIWLGGTAVLLSLAVLGCGDSGSETGSSGGSGQGGSAQGGSAQGGAAGSGQGGSATGGTAGSTGGNGGSGATSGEWTELMTGDWELPAAEEGYRCVVYTVPEDMYVAGFRPIAPNGTHHTVLSRETGSQADGIYPCDAGTNGPVMIYGSGVGTTPLEFPQGVAVKLKKGEKLLLNLHLFNVSPSGLSGRSGIEVRRVDPADVEHEAEMLLAGKDQGLVIDTGENTQTGHCTMTGDVTVFAVIPHMHQLGIHMQVSAETSAGSQQMVDTDYTFDDQQYHIQDPLVQLKAGDQVKVDCTYYNDRGETVYFGDSSLAEMCYAGIYRYPALGTPYITCTQ